MPAPGLKALELKLKELKGIKLKVGWFPSAKYPDGTSVAYIASIQEFGYGPIPPRPFMRTTVAEKQNSWAELAGKAAAAVLAEKNTAEDAVDKLGIQVENDISDKISTIINPPLSPITIELRARKKLNPVMQITGATVGSAASAVKTPGYQQPTDVSTKPLIDSGLMIATLTHVVDKA